ncbi:nitroreductase family protein [Anaerobacillus sp. CMMVII]|uniref:nitroreductase family protein n=1 Tax=Anaerobacillus sp. CMMVII TaxID=2755588 RepID=UPI0021B70EB8|nr:nitroreductase family protein [Anaerobacillus sp. CMMVII]MCT8138154.1 nitroreductase family protein [Anaerobacillus sp. CMMVII]
MSIRYEDWYKVIQIRRSRRTFVTKKIEDDKILTLNSAISELNGLYEGVRMIFIDQAPDTVFVGAIGPYGKITGAPAYLALIINNEGTFQFEKAGFIGQAIVLEAAKHGLSTCWVGGYFNREVSAQQVGISDEESVIAIIPIGHARKNLSLTEKMMNQVGDYHKRKSVDEIVEGLAQEDWPAWISSSVRAASLSPSAYNRQSVSFIIGKDHSISLKINNAQEDTNVPKGIDRGIAMLHLDVAIKYHNVVGQWRFDQDDNLVVFEKVGS